MRRSVASRRVVCKTFAATFYGLRLCEFMPIVLGGVQHTYINMNAKELVDSLVACGVAR